MYHEVPSVAYKAAWGYHTSSLWMLISDRNVRNDQVFAGIRLPIIVFEGIFFTAGFPNPFYGKTESYDRIAGSSDILRRIDASQSR